MASAPAIEALRLRLAPFTPDSGHTDWMRRATAHTRRTSIDLPRTLTVGGIERWLTVGEAGGGLPREYILGLLRRAGRDVRWHGLPTPTDVTDGLAYEPHGNGLDPERLTRHKGRRALAEAAVARLEALQAYVDGGKLKRLTWTREQIRTEAKDRADKAEKAAWADGTRWTANGGDAPLRREWDAAWHRRQLRAEVGKTDGHVSWILGLTGGRPEDGLPAYCSRWTLGRARDDAAAARKWAANSVHVRRDGSGKPKKGADGKPIVISTADLVSSSRDARRAQLYALCLGTQQLGIQLGYVLAFATLTLPAAWHPNPETGGTAYDPATSPLDAGRELQRRWHRARALMRKRKVRSFAGQAREVHRDGCPHAHVCEYVHPDDLENWADCLARHWPELPQHAGLPRAERVACQVRTWDDAGAANVATYMFGYASKSLAAAEGEADDDATAHAATCRRDRRRRWSWVGYRRGLVGDWQRVARERECPECPVLARVWRAIRGGRYAEALTALGALSPRDAPVCRDYHERENKYGEPVRQPLALRRVEPAAEGARPETAGGLRWKIGTWTRESRDGWTAEMEVTTMLTEIRAEIAADAGAQAFRAARVAEYFDGDDALPLAGDAPDSYPGREPTADELRQLDAIQAGWKAFVSMVAVKDSDPSSRGCAPQARHRGRLFQDADDPGGGIPIPPGQLAVDGDATKMAA